MIIEIQSYQILTPEICFNTPARFVTQLFILLGMGNGVKRGGGRVSVKLQSKSGGRYCDAWKSGGTAGL